MRTEKTRFSAKFHAVPEAIAKEKPFRVRRKLLDAVTDHLQRTAPSQGRCGTQDLAVLAQSLAFLPAFKSGWGPSDAEIEKVAGQLVDGYWAHLEACTLAEFPAPAEAALEFLKQFDFGIYFG